MRYALVTALAASAAFFPIDAQAREPLYQISIPSIDLAGALATLAGQTGVSVATDGPIPRFIARAVQGRMRPREALERMLRGSDWRAVRVGHNAFRIVLRKGAGAAAPVEPAASEEDVPPMPDIVVTARKLPEALSNAAAPIAVYVADRNSRPGVAATTRTVADTVEGLSLTNLASDRNRAFIRGIADSPFNGFSQSTVSVQVDDGRIIYDAADPGLRLVDVARVEVLKGPQGPLYGTGALGGVLRIVTNRPLLGITGGAGSFGFSSVLGGGIGGMADGVVNVPIISDVVAARVAGYASADGGWIDDANGRRNSNRSLTYGARASLRVAPADGWTIDLTGQFQSAAARDSQYVDRKGGDLTRNVPIVEPRTGRIAMIQSGVAGPIGDLQLTVATSMTWQNQADIYDATASAAALGVTGQATYRDRRRYQVFDQEVRVSSTREVGVSWLVGASYLSATTLANGDLSTSDQPWFPFFAIHRRISEAALFADGSIRLAPQWKLGAGVRLFRTTTDDERTESVNETFRAKSLLGVTPSASLSYEIAPDRLIYLRFGTAFRPGGIDPTNTRTGRYDADQVLSFDLGTRLRLSDGRLLVDGGFFVTSWHDIQSDYLEPTGLIATRNAGTAGNVGMEIGADWRPRGGWRVKGGATWQRPRLTRAPDGSELPADRRLPIVPDVAAHLLLSRDFDLSAWRITPELSGKLVGASRLSFDLGLDRRVPAYATGQFGIAAERDGTVIRFDVDNVLNTRADTFAFGNPFSVATIRQYTPLRPRTFSLSIARPF